MIHSPSTSFFEGKLMDVKVEAKEMERLNNIMCEVMADNCGKRKDFFKKYMSTNTDHYMSPEKALSCGLATHVGDARLKTRIVAETSIELIPYVKKKRKR